MLVSVTYTGANPDGLTLSWSTEPLVFKVGEETLVPVGLVPQLQALPGHGFIVNEPAPSISEGAAPVAEEPAPVEPEAPIEEPTPADPDPAAEEETPAPLKKRGRRPAEEA